MSNSNKYTLKHLNSIQSNGIIWKMVFDDEQNQVAWECRTKEKELFIYLLDFKTNKLLLNNYLIADGWNFSLDIIKNNKLYFSNYEQEFSPIKKGIIAFDIKNKSISWQNFTWAVDKYTDEGVLVYDARIFPKKFLLIDFNNGELLKSKKDSHHPLGNKILIAKNLQHEDILEETDLLNFNDLEFKSYYKKSGKELNQNIIVSKNNVVVFEDILNTAIQKKHIQPFVVWQNKLLYIKNKSEFVSYLV
jgi:hypothetical protein